MRSPPHSSLGDRVTLSQKKKKKYSALIMCQIDTILDASTTEMDEVQIVLVECYIYA